MPQTSEINQVGKREDLSDIIAVADAKSTIVSSMLPKGKRAMSTLLEWQADAYDATNTNGVVDGTDVEAFEDAAANRAKLQGRVQMFRRSPKVSTMAENVSVVAGLNDADAQGVRGSTEFARAKAKKTVELKRDIEAAILSDNESQADNGTLPYKFRGLGKWLQSTAQTDLPVDAAFRTPSGQIYASALTSFTEDSLKTLLQTRFDAVGKADELVLIAGTALKAKVSDFSRYEPNKSGELQVRRFDGKAGNTITNKVDVYEGDFGVVTIPEPSSFVPDAKRGYILDLRMLEIRPHTAPYYRDLPDLGGGPRGLIEAILAFCVTNPLSHCKIAAS